MVLCISSITGTIVTISLPVASVIDTIIATMLATSVASKGDTIVAVGFGPVTRVTTAIINRNIVAVLINFVKLLFRRHQSVAPTVCYLSPPLSCCRYRYFVEARSLTWHGGGGSRLVFRTMVPAVAILTTQIAGALIAKRGSTNVGHMA